MREFANCAKKPVTKSASESKLPTSGLLITRKYSRRVLKPRDQMAGLSKWSLAFTDLSTQEIFAILSTLANAKSMEILTRQTNRGKYFHQETHSQLSGGSTSAYNSNSES